MKYEGSGRLSKAMPLQSETPCCSVSRSYPGLKTLYMVNEVRVGVINSEANACRLIGLPTGTDFTFARREQLTKGFGSMSSAASLTWASVAEGLSSTCKPGLLSFPVSFACGLPLGRAFFANRSSSRPLYAWGWVTIIGVH